MCMHTFTYTKQKGLQITPYTSGQLSTIIPFLSLPIRPQPYRRWVVQNVAGNRFLTHFNAVHDHWGSKSEEGLQTTPSSQNQPSSIFNALNLPIRCQQYKLWVKIFWWECFSAHFGAVPAHFCFQKRERAANYTLHPRQAQHHYPIPQPAKQTSAIQTGGSRFWKPCR